MVDPVERVERVDAVENPARRIPSLERADLDLHAGKARELAPRNGGEIRSQLDGRDREAALGERQGRLARSATDLQERRAWTETCELDDVVEHLGRRNRPRAVVGLRDGIEARPEAVPVDLAHRADSSPSHARKR